MNAAKDRNLALIFDLDGVLVHSMPLHTLAWERYLESMGIHIEDLERRMHGKRNSELVRDLINPDLADDVIFEHGAAKERMFREMLLQAELSTYQVPGVRQFLQRHRDWPMAVGSNAELANIDFVLDATSCAPFFALSSMACRCNVRNRFPTST